MRGSVKVIKFTAPMSILFLALTYFITVNIEAHIIVLNMIWLSNNLALTVFGGARVIRTNYFLGYASQMGVPIESR